MLERLVSTEVGAVLLVDAFLLRDGRNEKETNCGYLQLFSLSLSHTHIFVRVLVLIASSCYLASPMFKCYVNSFIFFFFTLA